MKRIVSLILLAAVWLATVTAVCRNGSVPSVYFLPTVLTALVVAWQCFHWRLRNRANPKDDTRREVLEENNRAVLGTVNLVVQAGLSALQFSLLYHIYSTAGQTSLGGTAGFVLAFCGAVLLVGGNLLPKLRPNRYVGIRLPWIMHDEDRWARTHRFGGYVLVVCGALMLTLSVFPGSPRWTALALLASAVGIIIIYSWKVK